MTTPTKIATCSYCGTRVALVMKLDARHELTCSACAAPLDDLTLFQPNPAADQKHPVLRESPNKPVGLPPTQSKQVWRDDDDDEDRDDKDRRNSSKKLKKQKKKSKKRRKSLTERFLEDAKDAIEDLFD